VTPAVSRGAPANAPSGPRGGAAHGRDAVVDGSMGFDDPMETDSRGGYVIDAGRARPLDSRPRDGLYSDSLVQGNGGGQQRGGGGGRGYGRGGRRGGPGR